MAMLTGVGIQHENESNGRKSKMNIIQLEADGYGY